MISSFRKQGTIAAGFSKAHTYKTLAIDLTSSGVKIITLNRPKKKNAFNYEMYAELGSALKQGGEEPNVRVVLLTGAGDFYSSGNDLGNFSRVAHPKHVARIAKNVLQEFVDAFIQFPKPLVCAVNGPAIGIAVTTLGLCDHVLASERSTYNTPFASLGQSPEGCSSYTFPKVMGEDVANQILWEGKILTAEDAKHVGLVHSLHTPDTLQQVATAYCERIANLAVESDEYQTFLSNRHREVEKLREVNAIECNILEKKWISKKCFSALADFLDSRNMSVQANILRFANLTGPLWGQPKE